MLVSTNDMRISVLSQPTDQLQIVSLTIRPNQSASMLLAKPNTGLGFLLCPPYEAALRVAPRPSVCLSVPCLRFTRSRKAETSHLVETLRWTRVNSNLNASKTEVLWCRVRQRVAEVSYTLCDSLAVIGSDFFTVVMLRPRSRYFILILT